MRPVAPPFSVRRWPDGKAQFYPAIGDQCDLADVWALSKLHPDRVKQAVEAHWNMRLRGVKNSLWLFLGSSIDLDGLKQTCLAFGETYITLESPPTKIFPRPGLISYHCRVPPLNLTLVAVALNAMTSAKTQQEESLQHDVEDGVLARQWNLTVMEVRVLRESFEFSDADGSGNIGDDLSWP